MTTQEEYLETQRHNQDEADEERRRMQDAGLSNGDDFYVLKPDANGRLVAY